MAASRARGLSVVLLVVFVLGGLVVAYVGWTFVLIYQEREQRGRIFQAVRAADAWKNAIEAHYHAKKALPRTVDALPGGAPATSSSYGRVNLTGDGVLTITLTPEVGSEAGKTIVVAAQPSAGALQWHCAAAAIKPGLLPAACRP